MDENTPSNGNRRRNALARLSRFHRLGLAAVVAAIVVYYSYDIWFVEDVGKGSAETSDR